MTSTFNVYINCITEWSVQRRGIFCRIGHNCHILMPSTIKCGANSTHLSVHHAARRYNVRSGLCLCKRGFAIDRKRLIIVDVSVGPNNSAVPMGRVLINAQVGHDDHVIANCNSQISKCHLNNAIWVIRSRAHCVFYNRDSEQNHGAHAKVTQRNHFGDKRFTSVLNDAWQRHNRLRGRNSFANKQRRNKI